jgi:hypothetical protein
LREELRIVLLPLSKDANARHDVHTFLPAFVMLWPEGWRMLYSKADASTLAEPDYATMTRAERFPCRISLPVPNFGICRHCLEEGSGDA